MQADAAPSNPVNGIAIPTSEPLAYTVPEVAQALRISDRKAWAMVAAGKIESILIGSSRRVPRAALHDYVESLRGVA